MNNRTQKSAGVEAGEKLLESLAAADSGVDFATGIRQKFIAQGWGKSNAEKMVIAILENQTAAMLRGEG
ncbi:hypothetical protein [Glutamicibacter sp. NPDC087344]|uniref:hypothetical protein n=1 Tax=Glutamicibacter sp. NPDC087344 TaxID=3363994 RepID=UPI0037FD8422